jgi:hypothetical protein
MRFLGLALAGSLALMAPIAAHSASPGSNTGQTTTGPPPGIAQVGDGHNSNWHPAPDGGRGGWHPPHWGPGVPTYWVWGPSGGALDYPFFDWRGPTGGWGNP